MFLPIWFIYVIIALIFRGVSSLLTKIISHKNLDASSIFLIQTFISSIILLFVIDYSKFHLLFKTPILIYTILIGFLLYLHKKIGVLVLKDISASIMFISSRIFPTLLILIISMILFKEYLTRNELIGLILGITTFIFLYDTKDTSEKNSNFYRGIRNLIFHIIIGAALIILIKLSVNIDLKISLLLYSVFAFLFFFLEASYKNKIKLKILKKKENINFAIALAINFCILNYSLFVALSLANTAIIYKIYSYEIFIPIIYSILFLNEKLTLRKMIAFILTILSLMFFI